jgi:hypothetical protein
MATLAALTYTAEVGADEPRRAREHGRETWVQDTAGRVRKSGVRRM